MRMQFWCRKALSVMLCRSVPTVPVNNRPQGMMDMNQCTIPSAAACDVHLVYGNTGVASGKHVAAVLRFVIILPNTECQIAVWNIGILG